LEFSDRFYVPVTLGPIKELLISIENEDLVLLIAGLDVLDKGKFVAGAEWNAQPSH
jgi:hypothetical protein